MKLSLLSTICPPPPFDGCITREVACLCCLSAFMVVLFRGFTKIGKRLRWEVEGKKKSPITKKLYNRQSFSVYICTFVNEQSNTYSP